MFFWGAQRLHYKIQEGRPWALNLCLLYSVRAEEPRCGEYGQKNDPVSDWKEVKTSKEEVGGSKNNGSLGG